MTLPALETPAIRAMDVIAIDRVRKLESTLLQCTPAPIVTRHLLHAGMYHRTVTLPQDAVITGVFVKIPTTLVVSGDVETNIGRLTGYHVVPAHAGRKQAFLAYAQTHLTMSFPTAARTVEEAEAEFTDEVDLLVSHRNENVVTITGESK